jgi:endonuclease/exonuclease/phosphatase family metal-dependent hydrolase
MKFIRYILLFVAVVLLLIASFLIYTEKTIPNFAPEQAVFSTTKPTLLSDDTLSVLSWNIGYGGLGKEMDFFYDGGTRMRASEVDTKRYMEGIAQTLQKNVDTDFMLLQELDVKSKRTYFTNQKEFFDERLPAYKSFYAANYAVELIPMPVTNPLGKVNAGLATYAKRIPSRAVRHSYPDKHPWPEGLFMPKRCFLESRFKTRSGKELVLVNTHNSAYDDGSLRRLELEALRKFVVSEFDKGNWVIVGGDWNQNPTGYVQQNSDGDALKFFKPSEVPAGFFPKGWKLAWSKNEDTNRFMNKPYEEGETMTTTIDFFLISPNVELLGLSVLKQGFCFSDHEPIRASFALR